MMVAKPETTTVSSTALTTRPPGERRAMSSAALFIEPKSPFAGCLFDLGFAGAGVGAKVGVRIQVNQCFVSRLANNRFIIGEQANEDAFAMNAFLARDA